MGCLHHGIPALLGYILYREGVFTQLEKTPFYKNCDKKKGAFWSLCGLDTPHFSVKKMTVFYSLMISTLSQNDKYIKRLSDIILPGYHYDNRERQIWGNPQ